MTLLLWTDCPDYSPNLLHTFEETGSHGPELISICNNNNNMRILMTIICGMCEVSHVTNALTFLLHTFFYEFRFIEFHIRKGLDI